MTRRLTLPLTVILILIVGCASNSTSPTSSADAQSDDAGSVPQCLPQGDRCGPEEACCGSVIGQRVHLAANCAEPVAVLSCVQASTPGERCKMSTVIGCMARVVGGDEEVYVTNTLWRADQVPGYSMCSDALQQQAFAAYRQPCP